MLPLLALLALAADPPPPDPTAAAAEDIRQKVVTAIRNCPETKGDEIVVCSKDRGIAESYRLPKLDQRYAVSDPKVRKAEDAIAGPGDGGFGTCGAVGTGAGTGCALRDYRAWGDWKRRQRALRKAAEQDR